MRPIIFSTLVQDDMREIIKRANGLFLDFFAAFLGPLEQELKVKSSRAQGKRARHVRHRRVHAAHQRDQLRAGERRRRDTRDYDRADLVLVGVSRSGKTPTCLYMALQYGIFAANFPFAEEEFETGELPASLAKVQRKLYGLTIAPERLQQIRNERRPNSKYSSSSQVEYEVRTAEAIFRRYDIPCINTTECSIEEIASRILNNTGLERRCACDRDASLMPLAEGENRCAIFGPCWQRWNTTRIAQSAGAPGRAASSA